MPEATKGYILRILYIVSAWKRNPTDVITPWLVHQTSLLRAEGLDVQIFAPSYKGLASCENVHRFRYFPKRWETLTHEKPASEGASSWWGKVKAACYVLGGCVAAFRLNRREHYDWIHVHWPWPHALMGYAAKLAWPQSKIVWTFFGSEFSQMRGWRWLMRWLVQRVRCVTAISNYTAGLVHDRISRGVEVKVIPFGAVPRPVANHGRRIPYVMERVLFVGRLVSRKGIDILIEASREQRWNVIIIGDGPEFGRLWTLSRGMMNVQFLGTVSDLQLDQETRDASIFVLPARVDKRGDTEGEGVVLVEAMFYGLPIVASAVGGIPEVLVDYHRGCLVVPDSPYSLRVMIDLMLKAKWDDVEATVPDRFRWPTIIAQWREVYD